MKETHFRIIELPEYQVLLIKDFDDDEESKPLLTVSFFLDGIKVNQKFGYSEEEKRDKFFNEFTDKQAAQIVENALEMMSDLDEDANK